MRLLEGITDLDASINSIYIHLSPQTMPGTNEPKIV